MSNSLHVTSNTLDPEDFEVIHRALDLLERFAKEKLANAGNNIKQSAMISTWSRVLIARAKLLRMQGGAK